MNNDGLGREEARVALMLAKGHTKKEIAVKLNKSVNTVNNQTRRVYEKTGSMNLADLTRKVISRLLPDADVDRLITDAFRNMAIALACLATAYLMHHMGLLDKLEAALPVHKLKSILK